MEYSIQELSRLSGVTTRALRWYDQMGLLKPSRVAESGYRYYGPAEVDRLQDILYYRALRAATATTARRKWTGSRTSSITGPSGWSWPGSGNVWTIPPLTGWPRCKATWPLWRRSGRGWTP